MDYLLVLRRFALLILLLVFTAAFSLDESARPESASSWWQFIKGTPQQNTLFLDMCTYHFQRQSRLRDRWHNELVAVVYKGIAVGTLLNSHNDRSYTVDVARNVYQHNLRHNVKMALGYHLGVISGYGGKFPVLPFPQVFADFTYKDVGLMLSYVGIVVSAGFFVRF